MSKNLSISVRDLVEYILRSGDIDSNYISASRMQDGIRIHQKIQKERQKEAAVEGVVYDKEVSLSKVFKIEDFELKVDGRADGIWRKHNGEVIVEEIKSTSANVDFIEPDENHVHLAQAKFYAYFLADKEEHSSVIVRLTYVEFESLKRRELDCCFSFFELEGFVLEVVNEYFVWAKRDFERREKRDESIKASPFVFENYRKGQRELAVTVYHAIEDRTNLFAQAPTGTGKTISTLFPCIKAMGEGLLKKIFYFTAKTITRTIAEESAELMRKKGHNILSVTLTAKEKSCLTAEKICSPDYCRYAKGHFDRVNDAVSDIIENERNITRDVLQEYAKKHCVCPHEFALDVTNWSDVIIGDYNHVFDPKSRLKRFFGGSENQDFAVLIDEAHNLVDRSREMFSAGLKKSDFLMLKKLLKPIDLNLYKICDKINSFYLEFRKNEMDAQDVQVFREPPEDLYFLLNNFITQADRTLAENSGAKSEAFERLLELYFLVLDFLSVFEVFDDKYRVFAEANWTDFSIRLLCLDPSRRLKEVHDKIRATVFFSATLTPLSYFKQVFGCEAAEGFKLPTPFPKQNLCLLIEASVSTRYKDRQKSLFSVAESIKAMAGGRIGNYFAFFPSYSYLKEVYAIFIEKYPETRTMIQTQNLSEDGKTEFLRSFDESGSDTMIAFSVMGGMFSEGIDLVGDKLIGVAVVGVGLPQINAERDLIMQYYNEAFADHDGFDYAYSFPGINKVMQAAGRLIRTETDVGVVVLIDDRYASEKYQSLFPKEWSNAVYLRGAKAIQDEVKDFWGFGY